MESQMKFVVKYYEGGTYQEEYFRTREEAHYFIEAVLQPHNLGIGAQHGESKMGNLDKIWVEYFEALVVPSHSKSEADAKEDTALKELVRKAYEIGYKEGIYAGFNEGYVKGTQVFK
ncbi:unnamed protein product [Sphagnum balticum]